MQQQFPAVGETIHLKPAKQNSATKAHHLFSNLHIFLSDGAQEVNFEEDGVIKMFATIEDSEPVYQFKLNDLLNTYQTTECNYSVSLSLQNAFAGDTLFCNRSIDLSKVSYFTYQKEGAEAKAATSYLVEYIKPDLDLIAISISFH